MVCVLCFIHQLVIVLLNHNWRQLKQLVLLFHNPLHTQTTHKGCLTIPFYMYHYNISLIKLNYEPHLFICCAHIYCAIERVSSILFYTQSRRPVYIAKGTGLIFTKMLIPPCQLYFKVTGSCEVVSRPFTYWRLDANNLRSVTFKTNNK